jgi:hypothetical protein
MLLVKSSCLLLLVERISLSLDEICIVIVRLRGAPVPDVVIIIFAIGSIRCRVVSIYFDIVICEIIVVLTGWIFVIT